MRLDELVTLNDVLKANQYIKLLHRLSARSGNDINITRIKNKIIHSWKSGLKSKKHFDSLLTKLNLNVDKLLSE